MSYRIGSRHLGFDFRPVRRNKRPHDNSHRMSPEAARRAALCALIVIALVVGVGLAAPHAWPTEDERCQGWDAAAFHCRNTWIAALKTSFR